MRFLVPRDDDWRLPGLRTVCAVSPQMYTTGMFWGVWAVPTGNLIAAKTTEAEALAVVRGLLAVDWDASELTLIFDDPSVPDEELPPALTGDEVARRVAALNTLDARGAA